MNLLGTKFLLSITLKFVSSIDNLIFHYTIKFAHSLGFYDMIKNTERVVSSRILNITEILMKISMTYVLKLLPYLIGY